MSQSASNESERTLDIAARSLLASQAISGTVAGLVRDRAFDHAFVGLHQYAAIRVGIDRACEVIGALVERVHGEPEASTRPRAELYRSLRALLEGETARPIPPRSTLWWSAPSGHTEAYVALRASLSTRDAEVLELRFARRLTDEETAHVTSEDVALVRTIIARGLAASRARFGARPPSQDGSHEGLFLELFALDPSEAKPPRLGRREPVLATGTIVADRYEIEALLGVGAFADVYRARDCEVTGHVVALKILRTRSADARAVRSALRELQLLASVFHPSVVQLKDHGWHADHLWFVMPLYRGETLATRLERGPLSRPEARSVFEQLAEALATMHRVGVRHQDIKPENVFLANLDHEDDDTERAEDASKPRRILPVLLDLGVAAKDAELVLAGTPAYFAPEVAARFARVPDPPPVGPKADVFSLALTLRHALEPTTVAHVPGGAVDAFVSFRAVHAPPPPRASALDDLVPSFTRWLSTSPDDRPTAEGFRRELAVLTLPAERRAKRIAALRWFLPVAVTALAVFFAVVAELSLQAERSRTEATRAGERADRARARAQSISQTLNEQAARRAELEADVDRLEAQYQRSRMTREELASRLARTEGELSLLGDRDRAQVVRLRQQADELLALEREHTRLGASFALGEARIVELGEALARERARGNEAESSAARVSGQLDTALAALEETRASLASLEARMAALDAIARRAGTPLVLAPEVPTTP